MDTRSGEELEKSTNIPHMSKYDADAGPSRGLNEKGVLSLFRFSSPKIKVHPFDRSREAEKMVV